MDNPLQLTLVNFKKGAYIIVEGKQNADHFYIIRSGKVRLSKEVSIVQEEESDVLNPGDFFGVVSTMSNHSHIETAQALTDVSLIQVHRDQYGLLIEKNAPVALKIIQGFSKRMRHLDNALTKLTLKNSAETEDPNHLFQVAEYYLKQSKYNQAFYSYYQYIKNVPNGSNVAAAKERMMKIKPYAKVAYLDPPQNEFNRVYPKDTMIFSEGQPGNELYIIQKGSVKISKIVDDKEVLLAMLKPGDIFGEMALLDNKARSASADAYEDTELLVVNRANFQQMITKQPQLITRLTTLLADRIWLIYKQLANTTMETLTGRLYDAILIQLEKSRVPIREGQSHQLTFGVQELLKMIGVSPSEGNSALKELLKDTNIKVSDNKILIQDTMSIEKQVKFYRKMDKLNQSRQAAKR
jgi:CRP-like cAMP-binding protein